MSITKILEQKDGAKFYRADLHIHSISASHDVKDTAMTPDEIVKTAIQENLDIIAITDHNEIINVEKAIAIAKSTNLLVIPGVELSTPNGHLLCYFATINDLTRFYNQLTIVDHALPDSRCQQTILECLNLMLPLGGFGILAHVDAEKGFEKQVPGASPHKVDILCHSALLGIELKSAKSDISYAHGDPDPNRVKIGQDRISRLHLGMRQHLARVLNSDAHTLAALGRNAENDQKITRYKMDTPTFEALKIALEYADARVRIEEQIPKFVPRILGVHMEGGFLNEQTIRFSPNLNCIIGGRGTGKSTTFEAVRCLIHEYGDQNTVVDSEVWPEVLHFIWQDQAGQQHTLLRRKDQTIQNVNDPEMGQTSFDIDCFGQGEAARISEQAKLNPLALLEYLDKFISLEESLKAEESAREALLSLQTEIEKSEQQVQLIPQYERQLNIAQQQLTALQKPEVKELIELQRKLANEREIRAQIIAKLQEIKKDLSLHSLVETIDEMKELADPKILAIGVEEFKGIVDSTGTFKDEISNTEAKIKVSLLSFEQSVNTQLVAWKEKDGIAQGKIDIKKKELEALKIAFDMSYITKLAKDEASYTQSLAALKTWKPHLAELRKQRALTLKERWSARDNIAMLRNAFGRSASEVLNGALTDLKVSLKYSCNAYSPTASDQIIETMGWKTNQQPRANYLVQYLTIPILLKAVENNDIQPIVNIKTPEGIPVFDNTEAKNIIDKLSAPTVKFALERVVLHDLPRLHVTRPLVIEGKTEYIQRDFSKLSLGQKQSILLALMLSSNSNKPLIIDQPEDNLDGEFIFKTLIPVLRQAKERRQVIIVTHNPNIAVLGDAEQIIVMKATDDQARIVNRGSIDQVDIQEVACAILEGAKEAFLRRARIYGVS